MSRNVASATLSSGDNEEPSVTHLAKRVPATGDTNTTARLPWVGCLAWILLATNSASATDDEHWPTKVTAEKVMAVENALRVKGALNYPRSLREPPPRLLSNEDRRVFDVSLDWANAPVVLSDECDDGAFATRTGDALVEHIRNTPYDCINRLFSDAASRFAAFRKRNMVHVAEATMPLAVAYDGTNSGNIEELFLFLRAGFYVEFYEGDELDWRAPDDEITAAVAGALDAFKDNAHYYDETEDHFQGALGEATTLMDSAELQARYLPEAKSWLGRWHAGLLDTGGAIGAVNRFFVLIYRGHQRQAFVEAVADEHELVGILRDLALDDWMLDTDAEVIAENAGRELARFSQYGAAPILAGVRDGIKAILERYDMDGEGRHIWIATAAGAAYYDDCEIYGICGFEDELEARVLAVRHECGIAVTIRAQDLEPDELDEACALLEAQERYFHQRLRTGGIPVPDDFNASLEVVVFGDSAEYGTYSTLFFGNSTNNGGIYLEGDPSDPANTARFIAYVADWLEDEPIWNLEHEQVHYLDGRFNLHGSFFDYRVNTHRTVWWSEGLAEYISVGNDNRAAVDVGRSGERKLSEVFPTVYGDGNTMVYRWSYLAVRFMFERHRDVVDGLLAYFREGDYDGYLRHLNEELGTAYDEEWAAWLLDVPATEHDTPDLVELPRRLAIDEGSTATYAIRLAAAPSADVQVDIAAVGADLGLDPASLTFSPQDWESPQTVRVTAPEDDNAIHETATLVHTASGGGYDTARALVSVTVTDNAPTISFVEAAVAAEEGETAVLEVAIGRALESATTFGYRLGSDDDPATFDADAVDHEARDGEASIPAGQTQARIEVPIRDDDQIEPAREVLAVSLDPSTITGFVPRTTRANVLIEEGVCDRTPAVRDALRGDRPCSAVTVRDLAGLTYLILTGGLQGNLRTGDFQGLSRVSDLRLDGNSLTALPTGLFSEMRSLSWLFLNENNLAELPSGAFDGAGYLTFLKLNDNDLSELPDGLFRGLGELSQLELQGNPGAPFTLRLEWSRQQGFSVEATVREGAPFELRADVSASGGTASADSVVVPAGATASEPVTITPDGTGPVRIEFASTPTVPADPCGEIPCFHGLTTGVGGALVIVGDSVGFAHVPTSYALPAGVARRIDLGELFPSLEAVSGYSAQSSDASILDVEIVDGVLVLTPKSAGTAVVSVVATEPGVTTILDLSVTVADPVRTSVAYFPSAADPSGRQGFMRIVNLGGRASALGVDVFNDEGNAEGTLTLAVADGGAAHVNSRDFADGNAAKGLLGGAGAGPGPWRLDLAHLPDIQVLAYVRTNDGLLASMHDVARRAGNVHRVATFNPGRNSRAQSLLRMANPTAREASASIRGTDDNGTPGDEVAAVIPAHGSLTVSAHELESGTGSGLSGALGVGTGKWRLEVESTDAIRVMSLLSSATGHLTNLSGAPSSRLGRVHAVPMFPAASDPLDREGFVRVINRSDLEAAVDIAVFDETDRDYGSLTLAVGANRAVHFNSDDLELGNEAKGLSGSTGAGEGDWRLALTSDADIDVLAYVRTPDGFLTSMHDVVARREDSHRVPIFNPGRNVNQVSRLRLVNAGRSPPR